MISAQNISVKIQNKILLDGVSVDFGANEFCAILGANGAGKSTLLKSIAGFQEIAGGAIQFFGREINNWNTTEVAKYRSVLQQNVQVSGDMTVAEIVALGRYPYKIIDPIKEKDLVEECLLRFELSNFADRSIHSLSGGEQQRVHFARAYIQLLDPKNSEKKSVMFLDEPLNNLDINYQMQILTEAQRFVAEGLGTVIVVLHDLNLAQQFCDRVILMKDGKIIADGHPDHSLSSELLLEVFNISIRKQIAVDGTAFYLPENQYQLNNVI